MNDQLPPLSRDAFYGGRVMLSQPLEGLRATSDSLLLAASVPLGGRRILELGAGVGAAALAFAERLALQQERDDWALTAVERDPILAEILRRNILANQKNHLMTVIEDDALKDAPPWAGQHDLVMMNPPYNETQSTQSVAGHEAKASHDLNLWIKAAGRGLVHKGRMVMICRADRLDHVMAGAQNLFGDLCLKAVHSAPDRPAKRFILSGRIGVEGPTHILPPLMMRDENNEETLEMQDISRNGAAVDMHPPKRDAGRARL